ncbi:MULTISPECIES: hypothetical protein [unclassified Microbacterium]|uniref:hypothetical protein n=1 Tax=unclassified Microbacterium TaxID=2609290 RepID=UPI000EA92E33|nr:MULTISPECIES: hypothetical protein [unclassified Microbacterium]MBT2485199.1 hypothetical protein [Microbacterium sp. ISL-108]RKN68027.1 hypothetical protein D7252_10800 [Microbacterium sp. CGR2]
MKRNRRAGIAWAAALVVATVGLTLLIAGLLTPVSFGWFAYQPLADATFTPGDAGIFVSRMTLNGAALLALGLIGAAFLAGRRAGAARAGTAREPENTP